MSLRTKLATFGAVTREIENWPTAVLGQLFSKKGLATLSLRNGVTIDYRRDTEDWQTVREVLIDATYERAFAFLKNQPTPPLVLDLGANIGLFGVLAASINRSAEIHCFEPAKSNLVMLKRNCLTNPALSSRIHIHSDAVGGVDGNAEFHVNQETPQMSGFFGKSGTLETVTVRSFAKIVERLNRSIALVKIDVEGAEHEIVEKTPPSTWEIVQAIAMEVHSYPRGEGSKLELVKRMEALGFTTKREPGRDNYFFSRAS